MGTREGIASHPMEPGGRYEVIQIHIQVIRAATVHRITVVEIQILRRRADLPGELPVEPGLHREEGGQVPMNILLVEPEGIAPVDRPIPRKCALARPIDVAQGIWPDESTDPGIELPVPGIDEAGHGVGDVALEAREVVEVGGGGHSRVGALVNDLVLAAGGDAVAEGLHQSVPRLRDSRTCGRDTS